MSSYFDRVDQQIAACAEGTGDILDVEMKLVRDVTICIMFPDFPANLREAAHRVILRGAVEMLPINTTPTDFETFAEHKQHLLQMSSELHTIWHAVASPPHNGRDTPLAPLDALYTKGEEEREQLVWTLPVWTCTKCDRYGGGPPPALGCSRCGEPTVAGTRTFHEERLARGDDVPVWECEAGHGRWASRVEQPCPTCGAAGLHSGYDVGNAHAAGWTLHSSTEPS